MASASPANTRVLSIDIPVRAHARLETLAKAAGYPVSAYASTLLMAAYTARTKETGDQDLDAAVARVVVLDALESTPEETAAHVGLKPATVRMILKAWRSEISGQKAQP